MSKSIESHVGSSLLFTVIPDFHKLLSSLSLAVNALENSLLVSLENAESSFERLQHTRVLILDSFC